MAAKKTKKSAKKSAPKSKKVASKTTNSSNTSGITPLGDRVLVQRSAPEEMTSFGIIVPDTAKEKSEQGVVVAVGPGRKNEEGKTIPVSVSVGDKVQFSYGDEIKVKGVEYVLVREDNIIAIIN